MTNDKTIQHNIRKTRLFLSFNQNENEKNKLTLNVFSNKKSHDLFFLFRTTRKIHQRKIKTKIKKESKKNQKIDFLKKQETIKNDYRNRKNNYTKFAINYMNIVQFF